MEASQLVSAAGCLHMIFFFYLTEAADSLKKKKKKSFHGRIMASKLQPINAASIKGRFTQRRSNVWPGILHPILSLTIEPVPTVKLPPGTD